VQRLLQEREEATAGSALTQLIVRNAVSLAERCVKDTASAAASETAAADAKQGKKKTKKSQSIVDKFLQQVRLSI